MKPPFLSLILIVLPFFSALAYVPPPSYVVSKWTEKSKKIKTIHIRQKTTFTDSSNLVVDEEVWIKRPMMFRKSSAYPQGKQDTVVGKQAGRWIQERWQVGAPPELVGPLYAWYVHEDSKRTISFLHQSGVTGGQFRWALIDKKPVYEIGQVDGVRHWLTKEDWTPVGAEANGKRYKFIFSAPGKFKIPFPNTIEVYEGERLVETTEVVSVDIDKPISESTFDLPSSKKK